MSLCLELCSANSKVDSLAQFVAFTLPTFVSNGLIYGDSYWGGASTVIVIVIVTGRTR